MCSAPYLYIAFGVELNGQRGLSGFTAYALAHIVILYLIYIRVVREAGVLRGKVGREWGYG